MSKTKIIKFKKLGFKGLCHNSGSDCDVYQFKSTPVFLRRHKLYNYSSNEFWVRYSFVAPNDSGFSYDMTRIRAVARNSGTAVSYFDKMSRKTLVASFAVNRFKSKDRWNELYFRTCEDAKAMSCEQICSALVEIAELYAKDFDDYFNNPDETITAQADEKQLAGRLVREMLSSATCANKMMSEPKTVEFLRNIDTNTADYGLPDRPGYHRTLSSSYYSSLAYKTQDALLYFSRIKNKFIGRALLAIRNMERFMTDSTEYFEKSNALNKVLDNKNLTEVMNDHTAENDVLGQLCVRATMAIPGDIQKLRNELASLGVADTMTYDDWFSALSKTEQDALTRADDYNVWCF